MVCRCRPTCGIKFLLIVLYCLICLSLSACKNKMVDNNSSCGNSSIAYEQENFEDSSILNEPSNNSFYAYDEPKDFSVKDEEVKDDIASTDLGGSDTDKEQNKHNPDTDDDKGSSEQEILQPEDADDENGVSLPIDEW